MDILFCTTTTAKVHVGTRKGWYDVFLVSQHVRQGTVTPTHYNVVADKHWTQTRSYAKTCLPYDIKLYIIVHIKSSHHNFEDIMNVNRLYILIYFYCGNIENIHNYNWSF